MHAVDSLALVVKGEGFQIEVDPVRKVKVSTAGLNYEEGQLLIPEILLQHQKGNDLGDEVLEVIPVLTTPDDGVHSFTAQFCQHG